MQIHDKRTLSAVQEEFNKKFPYLKIEFYRQEHGEAEGTPGAMHLSADKTIGEVRSVQNTGKLSISGDQKVSTLESNFNEMYGLNVQVFRRSGNIWLQTTKTDNWTLKEQNERGESEAAFYEKKQ